MKVTANQLGLFIGATIHITELFLAEISQLYNPNFDTKTDFILKSVNAAGFTIEAPDGISQKLLSLADYGERCKLVLEPVEVVAARTETEVRALITDLVGFNENATDSGVLAAEVAILAMFSADVFNWIPADLAEYQHAKQVKLMQIDKAINENE